MVNSNSVDIYTMLPELIDVAEIKYLRMLLAAAKKEPQYIMRLQLPSITN